ncbi:MAG: hypothetical protein ACKVOU_03875 [Cytophagales bacterium]
MKKAMSVIGVLIICSCSKYSTITFKDYNNVLVVDENGKVFDSIPNNYMGVKLYYLKGQKDSVHYGVRCTPFVGLI